MTCQQLDQWITDNVEKWLEQWRNRAYQECSDARRWLEVRRKEFENWWRSQTKRCQEQPCQWFCLCCNKWLCWILDVLVRILILIIEVIERVVEAVCRLIITLIWLVLWLSVLLTKWIVLAVVCILLALCSILILIGALALLVVLLGILAL